LNDDAKSGLLRAFAECDANKKRNEKKSFGEISGKRKRKNRNQEKKGFSQETRAIALRFFRGDSADGCGPAEKRDSTANGTRLIFDKRRTWAKTSKNYREARATSTERQFKKKRSLKRLRDSSLKRGERTGANKERNKAVAGRGRGVSKSPKKEGVPGRERREHKFADEKARAAKPGRSKNLKGS